MLKVFDAMKAGGFIATPFELASRGVIKMSGEARSILEELLVSDKKYQKSELLLSRSTSLTAPIKS